MYPRIVSPYIITNCYFNIQLPIRFILAPSWTPVPLVCLGPLKRDRGTSLGPCGTLTPQKDRNSGVIQTVKVKTRIKLLMLTDMAKYGIILYLLSLYYHW